MSELKESVPPAPRRPGRERLGRAWTTTAAVIVALIVLAAVVVIFATRDRGKTPPAASPSLTPSIQPTASPTPSLPAQDQTVPVSAPGGVTWALFQGVALPSSRTAGPSRVVGPVYAGYAHTPTGALLAASQLSIRYLITSGEGWRRVVEQQVVPGAGRDAFVQKRATVTTTNVAPGTYGQLAGFRFVTYTSDVAVVQIVSRFRSGTLQVTTATVRWLNGDWRLQLQPDGSASPTAQRVDNLAGFVPWGGI